MKEKIQVNIVMEKTQVNIVMEQKRKVAPPAALRRSACQGGRKSGQEDSPLREGRGHCCRGEQERCRLGASNQGNH